MSKQIINSYDLICKKDFMEFYNKLDFMKNSVIFVKK